MNQPRMYERLFRTIEGAMHLADAVQAPDEAKSVDRLAQPSVPTSGSPDGGSDTLHDVRVGPQKPAIGRRKIGSLKQPRSGEYCICTLRDKLLIFDTIRRISKHTFYRNEVIPTNLFSYQAVVLNNQFQRPLKPLNTQLHFWD